MITMPVVQMVRSTFRKTLAESIGLRREFLFCLLLGSACFCGCSENGSTQTSVAIDSKSQPIPPVETKSKTGEPDAASELASETSQAAGLKAPRDAPSDKSPGSPRESEFAVIQPTSTAIEGDRFRLPDDRPIIITGDLQKEGIRIVGSRRLSLLTDVEGEGIDRIPLLADALFETLESELGPLLPAVDHHDFQTTGCLINAAERFTNAGFMPDPDFTIRHGRHLGYRFWCFNPDTEYYRRHLALHEFVHCFMMCEHGMQNIPPLWYTEGIAEFYATHQIKYVAPSAETVAEKPAKAESYRFGVLPSSVGEFPGWGRISEIRRSFRSEPVVGPEFGSVMELATGSSVLPPADSVSEGTSANGSSAVSTDAGFVSLETILHPATHRFAEDSQYAHAWALCWFLNSHPDYRDAFVRIRSVRRGDQFQAAFEQHLAPLLQPMSVDWLLTLDSLIEGFDIDRSFPRRSLTPALPLPATGDSATGDSAAVKALVSTVIAADKGWQSAGALVSRGDVLQFDASGSFQIADDNGAWISESNGITLAYYRGRPLGELVAMFVDPAGQYASRRFAIGAMAVVEAPFDAEIWLQLNESAAERMDNAGSVVVRICRLP